MKNVGVGSEGDLTVDTELTAYTGRVNTVPSDDCSTEVTSETAVASSAPAIRGRIERANELCADTT